MGRYKLWISLLLFLGLLVIAYYLSKEYGGSSSLPEAHKSFSIEDTSKIDKIFIAEQDGDSVLLEEKRDHWMVNDKFRAQKHKVEMLLETFYNMESKGPVGDTRKKTVIKNMSALNKRVEVYKEGEEVPFKIYYIGTATPHQDGTYMLLETPELGKAERPYVVHIPTRRGFLNPRFFTDREEWRYTGVFNYDLPNIKKVELKNYQFPEGSFYIENRPDGIALFRMKNDERIHDFDTVRVKDYLLAFEKAHVETYKHGLTKQQIDSIQDVGPAYRLRVIDAAGDTNELKAYRKPAPEDPRADSKLEQDVDRMYAMTDDGKFAVIQRYVFGRYFQPLTEFRKDYQDRQRGYRRLGPNPPGGYPNTSTHQKDRTGPPSKKDSAKSDSSKAPS